MHKELHQEYQEKTKTDESNQTKSNNKRGKLVKSGDVKINFTQAEYDKMLVDFVVNGMYPLSIVEQHYFKTYTKGK